MLYKKGDSRRKHDRHGNSESNPNKPLGGMSSNNRKNKQGPVYNKKNTPCLGNTNNVQFPPRVLRSSSSNPAQGKSTFSSTFNAHKLLPEYMRKDSQSHQGRVNQQRTREKPSAPVLRPQSDTISTIMEKEHLKGEHFNNNHSPNDAISLADVMSRLETLSHLPQKIDDMAEDLKQIRVLQETTIKMGKDISQVQADVHQLQQSVSHFQQENEKSKNVLTETQKKVQRLSTKVATLEADRLKNEENQQVLAKDLLALRAKIKQLENRLQEPSAANPSFPEFEFLKIDAAMRSHNVIIEGIREAQYERDGSTGDQAYHFIHNVLGLSRIEIDMAYRLGRPRYGFSSPRPILVRFTRLGDRMEVWNARTRLNSRRGSQYIIKEDLPPPLRPTQAVLLKVLQEAKRFPDRYRNVMVKDFKLILDGHCYGAEELESLPEELRPSSISTPGNQQVVVFFGKESRFSNHYICSFEVEGCSYNSIEQYLAHNRARIAGRKDLEDRAMASADPVQAKKILHLLRKEPNQEHWENQRRDVLFKGLLAKFSQSIDLREYLLSSENRLLGEASKNRTWGIGLTLSDRAKLNPRQWRGDNLQGNTLMEVRQHLLSTDPSAPILAVAVQSSVADSC